MPWDSVDKHRDEDGQEPPVELSPSQSRILILMAAGLPNKTIGWHLYVSEETVKSHVARLLKLTGTKNRAHLVAFAIRNGFIALHEAGTIPRDLMRRAA